MAGHMAIAYGAWEREEREGRYSQKSSWGSAGHLKDELYVQETPHIAQVSRPHLPEGISEIIPHPWAFNSRIFVAPHANAGQSR